MFNFKLKNIKILRLFLVLPFFTLLLDFIYTNYQKIIFPYSFVVVSEDLKEKVITFKPKINKRYYSQLNGHIRHCTNTNGFRVDCDNISDKKHYDYLFLGNIFTEGRHLSFNETFFGLIESTNKNLSIGNLGASSMQIDDYLKKIIKVINDKNITFDEIVLYLDISNFQNFSTISLSTKNKESFSLKKLIRNNFYLINKIYKYYLYSLDKSKLWAYSSSNHYSSWSKKNYNEIYNNSYKDLETLKKIFFLLKSKNIKLSIGVYPYPYNLLHENNDSNYVKLIENFCKNKCNFFFNSFPVFYEYLENNDKWNFIENNFIKFSVHHNKRGNLLIMENFNNTISLYN
ncbi:hypothetical protein N9T65_01060 [Candidatus Pelagibacter sp.]|nr:hypothetical protein [Candidatus Pelagibacter sp.]MDA9663449.1 hypothetical protein [Candidatus Pelagibacter sp.]